MADHHFDYERLLTIMSNTIYLLRYRGPVPPGGRPKIRDGAGHLAPMLTVAQEFVPFATRPAFDRGNEHFELLELDAEYTGEVMCALGHGSKEICKMTFSELVEYMEERQATINKAWETAQDACNTFSRASAVEVFIRLIRGQLSDERLQSDLLPKPAQDAMTATEFAESFQARSLSVLSPEEERKAASKHVS